MSQDRIQALQKILKDPDASVRQAAADSLDALEARGSLQSLIEQLRTGDRGQRIAAVCALEQVQSPGVFVPLLAALKNDDPDLRAAVARVLGSKRHPKTLGALVKALKDPVPGVQAEIIRALSAFSDRRIPACLAPYLKGGDEVALAAIDALAHLGFAEGEPFLLESLGDERSAVRRGAAAALGRLNQ
ncbi:MAG: hypothetical protein C0618_02745 [Desulfuromonas sp.]|nr:MAG: hypothetical protein C0618_02745 [Desulfuromonas sp.]